MLLLRASSIYRRFRMQRADGTFEEDIQCIVQPVQRKGAIYISNLQAASNPKTLLKFGIGAVITAAKGKNLSTTMPPDIQYLYIPAIDHDSFDLSKYFDEAYGLIDEERKRTNVLVHCMAGVSRSVTLVIAYLMKKQSITFEVAYQFVKTQRPIIHPNDSFVRQLRDHQKRLKHQIESYQFRDRTETVNRPKEGDYSHTDKSQQNNQKSQEFESYDARLKNSIRSLMQTSAHSKLAKKMTQSNLFGAEQGQKQWQWSTQNSWNRGITESRFLQSSSQNRFSEIRNEVNRSSKWQEQNIRHCDCCPRRQVNECFNKTQGQWRVSNCEGAQIRFAGLLCGKKTVKKPFR